MIEERRWDRGGQKEKQRDREYRQELTTDAP